MRELFFDRRTDEPTPLSFALFAVFFLGAGLVLLDYTLPDIDDGLVFSLFLVIVGAVYLFAAIVTAFPNVERQRWFAWIVGLAGGTLLLLLLWSIVLVMAS